MLRTEPVRGGGAGGIWKEKMTLIFVKMLLNPRFIDMISVRGVSLSENINVKIFSKRGLQTSLRPWNNGEKKGLLGNEMEVR